MGFLHWELSVSSSPGFHAKFWDDDGEDFILQLAGTRTPVATKDKQA